MFTQIPAMLSGFLGATLGRKGPMQSHLKACDPPRKAGEQLIPFLQAFSTPLSDFHRSS